jgi:hypothetical protein
MARMTPRQIERAFAQQPDAEDDNILVFEPADESCFPDEKQKGKAWKIIGMSGISLGNRMVILTILTTLILNNVSDY